MTLFGQKTDTSKVDSIVNGHLRRLLETPVACREQAPEPAAVFAGAAEPSSPAPAASGVTVVEFVDESVVVAPEELEPVFEPTSEVVAEPMSVSGDVARVAVYIVEEPATVEPVSEPPVTVCTQESEPDVVEPVIAPIAEPVAAIAPAVSDVAATLANDLARCLAGAFQNLQQHISAENQKFNSSLQQQIQRLQASVDSVAGLRQPVAELASAISGQRDANAANLVQYQQLTEAVATIEQSQTRNNTEVVTLRIEQLEMRAMVGAHSDDLEILKATACATARRVAGISDVMDRQSSVLRHLHEVESKRAAALERAFESLTCTSLQPVLAITA